LEDIVIQIDFDSPVPFWSQLRDILVQSIEKDFDPGDRLPTNQTLCDRYGVSRTTVRQALDRLENEGLIKRRKGSGTFVAKQSLSEGLQWTLSQFSQRGDVPTSVQHSIVRRLEIIETDEALRNRMELAEPCKVVALERVRVIEDEIRSISYCYLPSDLVPGLENLDFVNTSLYHTLGKKYKLRLHTSKREISAELATPEQAEILGIQPGDALLVVESHGYLPDGALVEYFKAYHLANQTRFNVVLKASQMSAKI